MSSAGSLAFWLGISVASLPGTPPTDGLALGAREGDDVSLIGARVGASVGDAIGDTVGGGVGEAVFVVKGKEVSGKEDDAVTGGGGCVVRSSFELAGMGETEGSNRASSGGAIFVGEKEGQKVAFSSVGRAEGQNVALISLGDGESVHELLDGSIVSVRFMSSIVGSIVGSDEGWNEGRATEGESVTDSRMASGVIKEESSSVTFSAEARVDDDADNRDPDDDSSSFAVPKTTPNVIATTTIDNAAMDNRKYSCRRCIFHCFIGISNKLSLNI